MFSFTNSTGLTIVDNATVAQTVTVPFGFTITRLTLSLNGLTHTFPADLDFLLVAPDGTSNLLFWSDAGGIEDQTNASFTISDAATTPLPNGAGLTNGTAYRPMNSTGADMLESDAEFGSATGGIAHPTPAGVATLASEFNGLPMNGTWTLYARDDSDGDEGSLASWTLNFFVASDLVVDGASGTDTLVVTMTGASSGSYSLNGAGAVPFTGITSLSFNGMDGSDVLTIVNPASGILSVPVFYDGGGQAGDALEFLGGTGISTVYTAATPSSGAIVHTVAEVQTVGVSGSSGTFTLSFNGQTTPALAFDATAPDVQTALNNLSTIGGAGGSVAVTGAGGNYAVTFGGTLAGTDVPQLSAGVTGATTVVINTTTQGGTPAITFTGLAPATDTVTENSFTIVGTAGADSITISDGGLVGGVQTWLISSPTFESMRVANKTTLIIDGNGGGDTVTMDTVVQAAGLLDLQIRGVNLVSETVAGAFNVQSLTIDAASSVALNNANNVDFFSAHLTDINGPVEYRDLNGFSVAGITTNGGHVTLATDVGDLVVGTAAADTGISTGIGNLVRLQATTGSVTQTANGAITGDTLGVRAGGFVLLAAAPNDAGSLAINAGAQVDYRDADDATIGAIAPSGIFSALTAGIASSGNNINLQTGDSLLLNDGLAGIASIDAGSADVRIVAGGTVDQVLAGDNIVADELGIIANGAVTLTAGLNDVNRLAIATAGLTEFSDTDDLTVGAVPAGGSAGFTGASGITSNNNDVNLRASAALTFDNDVEAGTGDIRLLAGAPVTASGRLLGDAVGIITIGDVIATAPNDANTLAIFATGDVIYTDADDLVIATVAAGGNAGFAGASGVNGSSVNVTTSSPLTVAADVTAAGSNIFLTAGDSAAVGDDLTVNGGVTVQAPAAAGIVVLRAGDNLSLLAGSTILAGNFLAGTVDFGNADPGIGGIGNLDGALVAPGANVLLGLDDGDTVFSAAGADSFVGNAGNDRLVWDPGDGSDTMDGGAGIDTLAFNGSAAGEEFALLPAGPNALFTRNVGGITMTLTDTEQLELAAGDGTNNNFLVFNMAGTGLTGLITYTGGSGTDTVFAAGGAINPFDVSSGGGNDAIVTGLAADRMRGEGGDDFLDGGAGDDTAAFSANLRDYQFAFLNTDVRIADRRAGAPDGADTLRQIENAEFADATLAILFGTPGEDNFVASGNQAISAGTGHDTITFDFRLVDATVTQSGHSVLIESGFTHTVVSGFDTYVFTDGTVNNQDADPLVDDLFYYARNHDVWTAHADADAHYHQSGWREGRDPSAFFDTSLYLDANPDVKAAGVDPLIHFDQSGWREGRVPSLTFDPRQYLAANADVAAAQVDPLLHFLAFGAEEGRLPFTPTELIGRNGFDYVFYLQNNPDVAAANVDPFQHFMTVGWTEGRNPNALFDVNGYLAACADVAAAHVNPLEHYHLFGFHEGRDPSVGFDTTSYLAAYPDVAAAGVDPLLHFLQFGIHEGRSPFADGVFG